MVMITGSGKVVVNLANNAIKFTDVGQVTVALDYADGCLELVVSDTGLGIPGDQCDAIFDAFTQLDERTSRKVGGAGLGLAICRRLVELMNGSILVESNVGHGAWFTVRIPCGPAALDQQRQQASTGLDDFIATMAVLRCWSLRITQ